LVLPLTPHSWKPHALGRNDLTLPPSVVIPALCDPTIANKIKRRHEVIVLSPAGQAADAAIDNSGLSTEQRAERWRWVYHKELRQSPA
jgi:hypothetical protein